MKVFNMFLPFSQLVHHLKKIPCCLFIYISQCCVYNRPSVNVVDTVDVNSKNLITTCLWGMMNGIFRNFCQVPFLLSLNYFFKKRERRKEVREREKEEKRKGKNILAGTIMIFLKKVGKLSAYSEIYCFLETCSEVQSFICYIY